MGNTHVAHSVKRDLKSPHVRLGYEQLSTARVAKALHVGKRAWYHLTALEDSLAVFWYWTILFSENNTQDTASTPATFWHTPIVFHVAQGTKGEVRATRRSVLKQFMQTITNPCNHLRNKTTVTVNQSPLKGWRRLGLLHATSGRTLMKA